MGFGENQCTTEGGTRRVHNISSSVGLAASRYSISVQSTAQLQALLLLSTVSVMSYYMDPVSYTALHPCDRMGAMRHNGGVAVGPQIQLPGVVHPQQQFYPSQPLYHQEIPLQEVPNGHDVCPTAPQWVGEADLEGNVFTRYPLLLFSPTLLCICLCLTLGLFSSSKVIDAGGLRDIHHGSRDWMQGARQRAKGRPSFSQASRLVSGEVEGA
ncbi:hypothetical protein Q8A73_006831 [Channa argus]|nr:hypothetical protein Q8A73_006831 [Channa argus]